MFGLLSERRALETETEFPTKQKIVIGILLGLLLMLIIVVIIIFAKESAEKEKYEKLISDYKNKQKKIEEKENKENYLKSGSLKEEWYDIYGKIIMNITYDEDGVIKNSFKINGENYNEEIGNLNNGKDYPKNERNVYDLYIPYSVLNKKNQHNGIFLFIHGGAWIGGSKDGGETYFCSRYAKMGYITANLGYTLLINQYKPFNIYRNVDEISACLRSIKRELINLGFNGDKLELAIGGYSAGAHLSTLYPFLMKKNSPIPVKFIINLAGPMSLESKYWYKAVNVTTILDNIETEEEINEGIKNGKINETFADDIYTLLFMNIFLGGKYTENDLKKMLDGNSKIKPDNEKYQDLLKRSLYAYPFHYLNQKDSLIPMICEYAGNDQIVGIAFYYSLLKAYKENGINITLIYNKYAGHELYHFNTTEGIKAMKEQHYQIMEYAKNFFTSD